MPSKHIRSTFPSTSGGGGPPIPCPNAFTDAFSLQINASDSNAAPTDDATLAIALSASDTNDAAYTDAVSLGFSGSGFSDSNAAPGDARTITLRVWLSNSTAVTDGVTNPANANGQNNGTLATVQTIVLGDNPAVLRSDLGVNVPTITVTNAIYRGWFRSQNTLVTSLSTVTATLGIAPFTVFTLFSNSAISSDINHLSGSFSFDLFAAGVDTLAKLQSISIRHITEDAAAGVTPATLTVDAGAVDVVGAF